MVEEAETALSFTVYSGNRCFLVSAPTEWQRDRWLEDISRAILAAKTSTSAGSSLGGAQFLHLGGNEATQTTSAGKEDASADAETSEKSREYLQRTFYLRPPHPHPF